MPLPKPTAPAARVPFRRLRALALAGTIALALGTAPPGAGAQVAGGGAFRALFDVRVPMRDGVELSADVWLPAAPGRYPVVLSRTPYDNSAARYPELGALYARHGYAYVVQDTRGRGDSDGAFDFFFTDAEDGHDTVEWLAEQPWSNGRVGTVGGSYLATVQWLAARERPAGLLCMIPQAPAGRYFHEIPYMGGAFVLEWALRWINGTTERQGQGANARRADHERAWWHRPLLTADSVAGREMPVYRAFLAHPTLDDYWRRIQFEAGDFEDLDMPALTFTGWFDEDQPGALYYWRQMRARSPAADRQHLIIGPWTHGGAIFGGATELGEWRFPASSVVDVNALHLEYFEHCLVGDDAAFDFPRARVFMTGANEWQDFADWPPPAAETRSLYLRSAGSANGLDGDGALSWEPPTDEPPDHYTFDPRDPVPSMVGGEYQGIDLRVLQDRDDVLVYETEPLTEPVAIAGNVALELHAATSARDTDFTAKLVDVLPDGRALKLGPWNAGVIRARYRDGFEREVLVEPGAVETYRIELFDIGHVFQPGHRIRLEVSSSAFPFINPNQNTGNPVATDTEWRTAEQTIFHDRDRASRLLLPVLGRKAEVEEEVEAGTEAGTGRRP